MRQNWLYLVVLIALLAALGGCTPQTAPATTPAPKASPTVPSTSTQTLPSVATDTAWDNIVKAAQKEGSVIFLSTVTFGGDIGITLTRAFKERTGIQLEILAGRGGTNYERIKTERRTGQMVTDLVSASGIYLKIMKTEGMLAGVPDLPVFRDKNVWLVNPLEWDAKGQIKHYERVWTSPYINTKLVKQQDWPTSLKDLLKPQWKGKMILSDPRTGSGTYRYYVPLVRRGVIDWEYVKALGKQDLIWQPNNSAAVQQVVQGAGLLTPINTSGPTIDMVLAGAPVKALSMDEGDLFNANSIGPVANAPHPNATKVFINWFLSEEGQIVFANIAKPEPVRKDTPNLVPKDVVPPNPNVKKIGVNEEDEEEAEKLFSQGFMAELLGLKR